MSTWVLLILAFLGGWATCWYLSRFLLKRVLRRDDSMVVDVIQGLPQKSLISVYRAVEDELDRRKQGIS